MNVRNTVRNLSETCPAKRPKQGVRLLLRNTSAFRTLRFGRTARCGLDGLALPDKAA